MEVTLPPAYGLAVLDVVLYALLMFWMGGQVVKARKTYNVPLPTPYEAKPDSAFNRYQRAHQNAVEGAAAFYITLLLSAIATPVLSAVAGLVFIVGRYLYCVGYYQSPEGRRKGSFYLGAQLYLVGGCVYLAVILLRS